VGIVRHRAHLRCEPDRVHRLPGDDGPHQGPGGPAAHGDLPEQARRDGQALIDKADPRRSDDQVGRIDWIKRFNIEYFLGLDGIQHAAGAADDPAQLPGHAGKLEDRQAVRGYLMLFLFLETGMLGTFLALDFFLFYIFWEVMLLPMYFLIGIWGGPRREYAAIKFFLYTLLGSVFILIALLGFYFTDVRDFVTKTWSRRKPSE